MAEFDSLWDYAHPDRTEAAFRALLPEVRAARDASYLAELLTQIARTQGLQRDYDAAHQTLDEAEQMIASESKRARVCCLLERGRVFNSSGRPETARLLFLQAWEAAREAGEDAYAIDAAHMLGIIEPGESALEWNRVGIRMAERSTDPRAQKWLGPLYNNSGWTYYDNGDFAAALTLLEKARDFYERRGTPRQIHIAKYAVGKTLRALGRVPEALAIQEGLRSETEQRADPDGYVYEEVAECLLILRGPDDARPHFARAHEHLSADPHLTETEPARLQRVKELGSRS